MGLIFQPGTDQAVSNKAAIDFERQARRLGLKEKRLEDFRFDPYGYVMFAYPWGQPGPGRLEQFSGPDKWQEEELREIGEEAKSRNFNGKDPVAPIRRTISSGHGIGKGAMAAWLTDWIMNTRTDAKGTITANTVKQLDTKTWATIQWWVKRSCYYDPVNKFTINNTWMRHVLYPESWYCSPQTCKEENAEAFAGQHNVTSTSFYVFDEACHDDQTDVLSKRGWIRFKDLLPEDKLLTKNPDTQVAEYVRPRALHCNWHKGKMFAYKRRGADIVVTGKHTMSHRVSNGRTGGFHYWRMESMGSLASKKNAESFMSRSIVWAAPDVENFKVPAFKSSRKLFPERVVDFDDWATFLGWYCSEGHTLKRISAKGAREYVGVGITNTDESELAEIFSVCERLGFRPKVYKSGLGVAKQVLTHDRAICEYLGTFGRNCIEKSIPPCIAQASVRQIKLFLAAYIKGDGYRNKTREVIYTSSRSMADTLQELCIKSGHNSTLSIRPLKGQTNRIENHNATSSCDGFVVTCTDKETAMVFRTRHIKQINYEGFVYCAELPKHHLLFTRRNGHCVWSGNSSVPDVVFDNADGGMTDGEPMIFVFGNPTRTTGKFWRIHWGADSKRWVHKSIDARTCAIPNKTEIANMIADFGEDSDKVRVRVRGLPPKVDEKQFIEMDKITAAIKRQVLPLDDEPLVAGLDVSGGGQSMHVLRFRRGPDARTIPPIRLRGDVSREVVIAKVAEVLRDQNPKRKVAMLFIDAGFFGSPIAERLKTLGFTNVVEVNFAETDTPDNYYANMRAYMWGRTKDWLPNGAIDAFPQLEIDLAGPGFHINKSNKVVLESKEDMAKRGLLSPDEADALVLTFAQHVAPVKKPERAVLPSQLLGGGGGARSLGWMK